MKIIIIAFLLLTSLFSSEIGNKENQEEKLDTKHNLVWQDTRLNATERMSYKSAISYCAYLKIQSGKDWRLPSSQDYENIIDTTRIPTINKIFTYCASDGYWTLNQKLDSTQVEWIDFTDGNVYKGSGFEKQLYTRCVHNK